MSEQWQEELQQAIDESTRLIEEVSQFNSRYHELEQQENLNYSDEEESPVPQRPQQAVQAQNSFATASSEHEELEFSNLRAFDVNVESEQQSVSEDIPSLEFVRTRSGRRSMPPRNDVYCAAAVKSTNRPSRRNANGPARRGRSRKTARVTAQEANASVASLEISAEIVDLTTPQRNNPESPPCFTIVDTIDLSTPEISRRRIRGKLSMGATEEQPSTQITDSNNINIQCSICLDNMTDKEPTSAHCGHLFCGDCIRRAIAGTRKCPICKTRTGPRQLHRIYF